ncbi:MAG: hypothetical protein QGG88_06045 [Gammaproteobacteria bacterium]|jgi:uncharacterized OsmC-like protein|nr:hypothetical protein [Gammaproteobacteria bacterium]
MFAIDTYTLAPLSASLAVVAGCVVITLVGIKKIKRFMAEDAAKIKVTSK